MSYALHSASAFVTRPANVTPYGFSQFMTGDDNSIHVIPQFNTRMTSITSARVEFDFPMVIPTRVFLFNRDPRSFFTSVDGSGVTFTGLASLCEHVLTFTNATLVGGFTHMSLPQPLVNVMECPEGVIYAVLTSNGAGTPVSGGRMKVELFTETMITQV